MFFTIIIGVVIPFFLNHNFERGVFGTILTLLVLCFGYYIRVKPLSIRSNRISIYIVGLGSIFGGIIWMFLLGIGVVRWMIYVMGPNENIGIGLSIVVSFGIGAILGDLIGKAFPVDCQGSSRWNCVFICGCYEETVATAQFFLQQTDRVVHAGAAQGV